MNRIIAPIIFGVSVGLSLGCAAQASDNSSMDGAMPQLVAPDGSYPTVPLEKDVVVVKVVQNGVKNLQDFDSVDEGLAFNLKYMVSFAERACNEGKKPDFILFNEFPLTGYSSGARAERSGARTR